MRSRVRPTRECGWACRMGDGTCAWDRWTPHAGRRSGALTLSWASVRGAVPASAGWPAARASYSVGLPVGVRAHRAGPRRVLRGLRRRGGRVGGSAREGARPGLGVRAGGQREGRAGCGLCVSVCVSAATLRGSCSRASWAGQRAVRCAKPSRLCRRTAHGFSAPAGAGRGGDFGERGGTTRVMGVDGDADQEGYGKHGGGPHGVGAQADRARADRFRLTAGRGRSIGSAPTPPSPHPRPHPPPPRTQPPTPQLAATDPSCVNAGLDQPDSCPYHDADTVRRRSDRVPGSPPAREEGAALHFVAAEQ